MRRLEFGIVTLIVSVIIAGCNSASMTLQGGPTPVPAVHFPTGVIDRTSLQEYVLAFCTRSLTPNQNGDIRTDVVVTKAIYTSPITITYPTPPRRTTVNLGCFGKDDVFFWGEYGLAWRQHQLRKQLTMALGYSGPPGDELYFVDIPDDLGIQLPKQPVLEQDKYFLYPNTLTWSPTGEWLATKGIDANNARLEDVWIYNPETDVAKRFTDYERIPAFYEQVGWSSSGRYVAITYGPGLAGIEITNIDGSSTVEVSNRKNPAVSAWPPLGVATDIDPSFSRYLYKSSKPIWTDGDQKVIFMAPVSPQRTALFQVNADGNNLQELLPELPGLVGLPTLSKDGHKLAFVRYPGWQSRDRAEIALVDLTTKQLTSLAACRREHNGRRKTPLGRVFQVRIATYSPLVASKHPQTGAEISSPTGC